MDLKKFMTRDVILGSIIFFAFTWLYSYTAAPSIYVGDSGELAAGIKNLEVVHPTGFPFYLVTANLFSHFFTASSFAFSLNIYSAILTAASLVLIFFTLKSFNISTTTSLLTSIILGLGKTIWFHAGTNGVYPLSLLFISILLLIFSRWMKGGKIKYVYLYVFIWALSLGTHVLMLSIFFPLIYMIRVTIPKVSSKVRVMAIAVLLFIVPFAQYLYLFIARGRQKTITTYKIDTLTETWNYLRQKDYTYKIAARTWEETTAFIEKTISLFTSEFTIALFLIALVGFFYLFKKNHTFAMILASIIFMNITIMFVYGSSGDLSILFRYYFLSYAVMSLFIGIGIEAIIDKINKNHKIITFAILVGILLFQTNSSYAQNNRKNNFIVPDLANNMMLSMEPDSIIISLGDSITGPLWYLQSIGIRADVKVIDLNLLRDDAYIKNWAKKDSSIINEDFLNLKGSDQLKLRLIALLEKHIDNRKIYIISNPTDKDIIKNFEILPVGVVNQVFKRGTTSIQDVKRLNSANWQKYTLRDVKTGMYKDSFVDQLIQLYAIMLNNLGVAYYNAGMLEDAKQIFEKLLEINPGNTAAQNALKLIKQKLP